MGDWRGAREMPVRKWAAKERGRKPPRGSWQTMVPSWEKDFCSQVCSIPWWKVCEAKRPLSTFENVVQWDDSAGKEAFLNAKKRFWAKINGLPCDHSLPDPDIYIDKIDWNAVNDVDPELIAWEQEHHTSLRTEINEEGGGQLSNNWENFADFSCNQGNGQFQFPCSGWGDEDDDQPQAANECNVELDRWKSSADNHVQSTGNWDSWGIQAKTGQTENNATSTQGWNQWHASEKPNAQLTISGWDDVGFEDWPRWGWENDCWNSRKTQDWNQGLTEWSKHDHGVRGRTGWSYGNSRKREGSGWYGARYNKTTRYRSDPNERLAANGGWSNCGGRMRENHSNHGRTLLGK